MNIKTLIIFLKMVQKQDQGIWINDFLDTDTQNGKCFLYCLNAKMIETFTLSDDCTGYKETYAELSQLGEDLVEMNNVAKKAITGKLFKPTKVMTKGTDLNFFTGKPVPSNPLLVNKLFATPESFQTLEDYCLRHNGSERSAAITCSNMAINLCHKSVEEMLSR